MSKWENGLSVPDSGILISLAEELGTSVSVLLGEIVQEREQDDLRAISEQLEMINLQLARSREAKIKTIRWLLILLCALILLIFITFAAMQSSYLYLDYTDPESAVAGTIMHGFEWFFIRLAPLVFIASVIGIALPIGKNNAQLVWVISILEKDSD